MNSRFTVLLAVPALLVTGACVSTSKYQKEQSRGNALETQANQLGTQVNQLQAQLDQLTHEKNALSDNLNASKEENAKLSSTLQSSKSELTQKVGGLTTENAA